MKYEILKLQERIEIGIEAGESHFREFKSAFDRDSDGKTSPRDFKAICRDIADALVAFANADGGEVYLGVEDDGTVSGIPHKPDLISGMKDSYGKYIHQDTPIPGSSVGNVTIAGKDVLYFSVPKNIARIILTSDGRCLKRFDRENRPCAIENIQAERQEILSREYDRTFVDGATIADLDLDLMLGACETITPGYSSEKMLQYLGLAEYESSGLRIRRAALLLFASNINKWHPRCLIRFVRINGTELGVGTNYNVTIDEPIPGAILKLLEDGWNALRPHLARTRFESGGIFRESMIYPEAACREALLNAIAHRDYSREGSPIEVFIYNDRMEFRSPGGLLSTMTIEKINKFEGAHESRNVLISKTLRELGFMREMGEGIPRMYRVMRESELVDPVFLTDKESFKAILRHKSIFSRQDIEWLEGFREFNLNKNEQRVVLLGKDGHLLSTNEIIKVTGFVDTDDFRALYETLRQKGIIFNAKPTAGGGKGGRRRETGRFQIRTPKEVEQYFGELIEALRSIAPKNMLTLDDNRIIKGKLSSKSPYAERIDLSLQALGFIDSQKRFLPKAFSFIPELESRPITKMETGVIVALKPARYGFIRTDSGDDYYFHKANLCEGLIWETLSIGTRVKFEFKPSKTLGEKDVAANIQLNPDKK